MAEISGKIGNNIVRRNNGIGKNILRQGVQIRRIRLFLEVLTIVRIRGPWGIIIVILVFLEDVGNVAKGGITVLVSVFRLVDNLRVGIVINYYTNIKIKICFIETVNGKGTFRTV